MADNGFCPAVRFLRGRCEDDGFRLRNVAPKWEGKSFPELSEDDQVRLRDTVLPTTVVQQPAADDGMGMYYVFERLSNDGVRFSPMEVRKCVYAGDYFRLLEKLNGNRSWRAIFGTDSPDRRLRDVELILRFFAMRDGWSAYEKPMKSFLNRYMIATSRLGEAAMQHAAHVFEATCADVVRQLGARPFHRLGGILVPGPAGYGHGDDVAGSGDGHHRRRRTI